ncbi:MAG TPA: SDR family NAD(P)-dependent oxidoreductase [Solirubrobacteraceae bacterium]|nr:SDR family NAD(P)-dependent oxidoreductase [Solirubrobacteraceae bacterium]
MDAGERGVALVTGANRGIGREVARQLAGLGYEVLLSARELTKAQRAAEEVAGRLAAEGGGAGAAGGLGGAPGGQEGAAAAGTIVAVELDVSDPVSIAAAAERIGASVGRLDVLVNNAGVGLDWGVSGTAPDFEAMERTLRTNLYGAWRLTVAVLELLRASEHPRIVNVSSGMGGVSEMGGWSPGYRVSKAGLNAMTRILATELKEEGVLVNSACPGFVATDMGNQFGAQKPVEEGAAGIVWLATLPDDGPTGGFFRDGKAIAF